MFNYFNVRHAVTPLAVIVVVVAFTTSTIAQGTAKKPSVKKAGSILTPLERLDAAVTLTAAQKSRVRPLLARMKQGRAVLYADTALTNEEKQGRIRELGRATRKKVEAILTAEQRVRFRDALEKFEKEKAGQGNP